MIYTHSKIYEEMMQNVEMSIIELFKELNISLDNVTVALEAFKIHSQNEMFGSSRLNQATLLKEGDCQKIDGLFDECQIPIKLNTTLAQLSDLIH